MAKPSPPEGPGIHEGVDLADRRWVRRAYSAVCLVTDAVLIFLFAVMGNISHESGLTPGALWTTAWPFLLGLALGWWATSGWRSPSSIWPSGILLVIVTVTGGMILRHYFTNGGAQLSFILVATLTLGILMLGRRLLTKLLLPRRGT